MNQSRPLGRFMVMAGWAIVMLAFGQLLGASAGLSGGLWHRAEQALTMGAIFTVVFFAGHCLKLRRGDIWPRSARRTALTPTSRRVLYLRSFQADHAGARQSRHPRPYRANPHGGGRHRPSVPTYRPSPRLDVLRPSLSGGENCLHLVISTRRRGR